MNGTMRRTEQCNGHIQLLLNNPRKAREHEVALQEHEAVLPREEMAQTAVFNQAFLGVLGKLVDQMGSRRV